MTSWGTYTKADLNAALTDYTSELHTLGLALPTIWPRSIEPLGAGATTGWIKTIVSQREHGYISPMAAGRDLRFHSDSVVGLIFQQLRVGTFVRYDESENLAINVQRGPGPRECLEDALNAIGNPALFNQESAELIAAWLVKVAEILEDSQEDGDYEKISQLCNAAFRVYKSLGDRNQYIRERRSTIQMFYWAYLGSFMASQRDDFEVCMQSFSDIVTRAFDNDRAGLLNARRGTEDTLIFLEVESTPDQVLPRHVEL